jgi:hypothetical protein
VRFVETPVFTREITSLMPDDDYRSLQIALLLRPEAGAVVRGAGGLRKIRWALPGRGKRGGVRVIYYWHPAHETFFMLFAYPKSVKDDLTARQMRALSKFVREELQ